MAKRVFIIHCWEGAPNAHWYPWLKQELEQKGFDVQVPSMPDTDAPVLDRWLDRVALVVGEVDEETYFIGHSLGCVTIMKFLEELPHGQKAGGVVFVGGYPESIGYDELITFFATRPRYEKVRKAAKAFVAIHSDNDPYVPLDSGYILRNELAAKLIIVPGAGHFEAEGGITELSVVRDELLAMAGDANT